ncbi:glycosyltransferase family 4 protein [Pedobacter arcticus]|uniref:glycosyltransferase family 4 protein n=1 Tax=Pedobacter arcticus TaxID=752140 RepID=UPI0002E1BB7E|nr:glycosyltransferase family 1 protein [Pedobacter arcticus]
MNLGFDAKRLYHNTTGLGNYSRDLIRILTEYYPENTYQLFNPKKGKHKLFTSNTSSIIERNPEDFISRSIPSFWRSSGIKNDLKKHEIDLFHGLSGELPFGITKTNIKSVVTIHDLIFIRYPHLFKYIDRKTYLKKFSYAAKNSNKIIAISEQTKLDIIDFLGINEDKIEVIYQGCHPAFKKEENKQEQNSLILKLGLPKDFILNVGTIEARKNVFNVVKSIKDLDVPLVIIGKETNYSNEIYKYVAQNNLTKRVIFLKGISMNDLALIYKSAKAFVYPSLFEGFGIPIIEALYSKTPVIITADGVFPEAGGPSSYYVDPNNIDELTHAIKDVLSNSELSSNMVKDGFRFVQKFNDDVIAKQMNDLYTKVSNQ